MVSGAFCLLLFVASCILTRRYWQPRDGVLDDVARAGIGGGGGDCKI